MKKLKRLFAEKSFIKRLHAKKTFGIIAVGTSLVAFGTPAPAQIVSDNFTTGAGNYTQTNGSQNEISNFAPSVDLPGGNYLVATGNYGAQTEQTNAHGGIASTFGAFAAATDLVVLGAYNTGSLAVSGTLGYGQPNSGGDPVGVAPDSSAVALLGFTSQTTASGNYNGFSIYTGFTGLAAAADGSLQEYLSGATVGSPIAFGGTYNPLTATTLTYDLNTATGAISNVSFGSSTATYNFATSGTFSNLDTASVLLGGTGSTTGYSLAEFPSFSVSAVAAVPEPSTYSLLAGGVLALGAFHYRRRQQAGI